MLPPNRPRLGVLAGIGPMLPQGIGGNCKLDGGAGDEAVGEHARAADARSPGPVRPALAKSRLKIGPVCRSVWVISVNRSASRDCIMRRI